MIFRASLADAETAASLALQMWTSHSLADLTEEFEELISRSDAAVFLLKTDDRFVGFAQCQLRYDYVEGTESAPVGYLEGIFVDPSCRKRGYAAELLKACENWAKEKGCREFASDCELDNTQSLAFHMASGFRETNRIICFTKNL